jgi:hypothetical protein
MTNEAICTLNADNEPPTKTPHRCRISLNVRCGRALDRPNEELLEGALAPRPYAASVLGYVHLCQHEQQMLEQATTEGSQYPIQLQRRHRKGARQACRSWESSAWNPRLRTWFG